MRPSACLPRFASGIVFLGVAFAPSPGVAARLAVSVVHDGRPVADAVVTVVPADGATATARGQVPAVAEFDQRELRFEPFVQVARPGGAAVFRNSDPTRHHVYSFSPAASFEMVLGPGEQSGRVPLREPGVVAIGCNIHDRMIAWLYVSDAPWIDGTDAEGTVRFAAVPPGEYLVRAWHPRLDAKRDAVERRVTVGEGDASLQLALRLRPGVRSGPDPERAAY